MYLHLIPKLPQGTLIHIHDIFLPYDYPRDWVIDQRWGFTEQYLVQALLTYSDAFEVIWAGYYLQQTLPQFAKYFPHAHNRTGKSLWLRKRHAPIASSTQVTGEAARSTSSITGNSRCQTY
ncbi:hypothetical protein C2W62_25200 [Candidatus Entotheonella serta]|nr:hypothetical protein C2W62_25200 [Candidatus Entotheonella serta]